MQNTWKGRGERNRLRALGDARGRRDRLIMVKEREESILWQEYAPLENKVPRLPLLLIAYKQVFPWVF